MELSPGDTGRGVQRSAAAHGGRGRGRAGAGAQRRRGAGARAAGAAGARRLATRHYQGQILLVEQVGTYNCWRFKFNSDAERRGVEWPTNDGSTSWCRCCVSGVQMGRRRLGWVWRQDPRVRIRVGSGVALHEGVTAAEASEASVQPLPAVASWSANTFATSLQGKVHQ